MVKKQIRPIRIKDMDIYVYGNNVLNWNSFLTMFIIILRSNSNCILSLAMLCGSKTLGIEI